MTKVKKAKLGADSTVAGAKGQKGEVGSKGQKGEVGSKGQKGEVGSKGQKGEVGSKGQKGEVGSKGQKGEVGSKGQKGDGFDTATNVSPSGYIGSGGYQMFNSDGEQVSFFSPNSTTFPRTVEAAGTPPHSTATNGTGDYPSGNGKIKFLYYTSSIAIMRIHFYTAAGTNQDDLITNIRAYDHIMVRSEDNKDRYLFAQVYTVSRNTNSAAKFIDIWMQRYSGGPVTLNPPGAGSDFWTDLESAFGTDDVTVQYVNSVAAGSNLDNSASLALGNGGAMNRYKVRLNGEYHTGGLASRFYPIDIGTMNNYHGDLYSSYPSMTFETYSQYQGFVWRYKTANSSLGAGMALRADGRLNVAYGIRVGAGVNDTVDVSSTYRLYVSGQIYSTSNISAYSDKRAKENIKPITDGLEKVLKLEGVYYNMKEGHAPNEDHTRPRVGVLAQDVQKILPEVVTYAEEEDMYSVDYGNITAVLIEAIKDQQKIIDNLSERISKLEK